METTKTGNGTDATSAKQVIKASTAIVLDLRKQKKDETYPLKLRVTYQRVPRAYGVKIKLYNGKVIDSLTVDDFERAQGIKATNLKPVYSLDKETYKEINQRLTVIERRANDIINELREFSFTSFAARFTGKRGEPGNVFTAFETKIAELNKAGRVGTAITYYNTLTSLKKYHKEIRRSDKLTFDDLSTKYLKDYEAWLTSEKIITIGKEKEQTKNKPGATLTTVGIYLRNLRALHNEAIHNGEATAEAYSFGSEKHFKYQIPAPRNIKKALKIADIKKIFDYKPANNTESLYRDIWLFSYLCNGANLKDISLLRYKDISETAITFRREKTARTNRKQLPITASNTELTKKIIETHGTRPQEPGNFVFPVLHPEYTPIQIHTVVQDLTYKVNRTMKVVRQAVGIPATITSYTARHSFASILKNSGVPVQFISESLGHSNVLTTAAYLDSLEDTARAEIAKNLTNFEQ